MYPISHSYDLTKQSIQVFTLTFYLMISSHDWKVTSFAHEFSFYHLDLLLGTWLIFNSSILILGWQITQALNLPELGGSQSLQNSCLYFLLPDNLVTVHKPCSIAKEAVVRVECKLNELSFLVDRADVYRYTMSCTTNMTIRNHLFTVVLIDLSKYIPHMREPRPIVW